MNDNTIIILNAISIFLLLMLVSYLSHMTENLNKAFWAWIKGETTWSKVKQYRIYFWCYLLMPSMLVFAAVQISQLNIGIPFIKTDVAFVVSTVVWLCLFFLVKGLYHRAKDKI